MSAVLGTYRVLSGHQAQTAQPSILAVRARLLNTPAPLTHTPEQTDSTAHHSSTPRKRGWCEGHPKPVTQTRRHPAVHHAQKITPDSNHSANGRTQETTRRSTKEHRGSPCWGWKAVGQPQPRPPNSCQPETNAPLQWLPAQVNHPGAPLRLRMTAANALLRRFERCSTA